VHPGWTVVAGARRFAEIHVALHLRSGNSSVFVYRLERLRIFVRSQRQASFRGLATPLSRSSSAARYCLKSGRLERIGRRIRTYPRSRARLSRTRPSCRSCLRAGPSAPSWVDSRGVKKGQLACRGFVGRSPECQTVEPWSATSEIIPTAAASSPHLSSSTQRVEPPPELVYGLDALARATDARVMVLASFAGPDLTARAHLASDRPITPGDPWPLQLPKLLRIVGAPGMMTFPGGAHLRPHTGSCRLFNVGARRPRACLRRRMLVAWHASHMNVRPASAPDSGTRFRRTDAQAVSAMVRWA